MDDEAERLIDALITKASAYGYAQAEESAHDTLVPALKEEVATLKKQLLDRIYFLKHNGAAIVSASGSRN
jgi:hypothetical protein